MKIDYVRVMEASIPLSKAFSPLSPQESGDYVLFAMMRSRMMGVSVWSVETFFTRDVLVQRFL